MEHLEKNEKAEQHIPSDEKGLSHFLASLPKEEGEDSPFFVKLKENIKALLRDLWHYFRSPEFFIWVRNWLKTNLFYLFPASFAAPLMTYCFMGSNTPRLKLLEYGTLDTLWRANLLSLGIVLFLGWCQRIVRAKKVEVKKNPHPFFRLFWYWVGANFIYILPILFYGSIKTAWYFLDGMERFQWVSFLVIELWSVATFFSLLIMSLTAATEWVFASLGRSSSTELPEDGEEIVTEIKKIEVTEQAAEMPEEEVTVIEKTGSVEDVKILDKKADDDKEHTA